VYPASILAPWKASPSSREVATNPMYQRFKRNSGARCYGRES
jgi:hypothetical protein